MRPGLEVLACDPLCLRLEAQGVPLLWARIGSDYWGYDLLRPRRTESVNVLPPISFDLVHENDARAGANSRSAWARTYAEMLATSEACPIGAGQWVLERGNDGLGDADLSLDMVNTILAQH